VTSGQETLEMNPKRESLLLAGVQALILLICLGGIAWAVATRLVFDVDGLLLVMIGLALSAVFAFTLLLQAKSEGWLDKLPRPGRKKASAGEESPASAAEKLPAGQPK
jgi:hypothetical protein